MHAEYFMLSCSRKCLFRDRPHSHPETEVKWTTQNTLRSCDQLNDTASLFDLSLRLLAEPSCSYNDWDFWDSTFSEDFGVPEWEEVENGGGVGFLARNVGFAGLFRNQRPELPYVNICLFYLSHHVWDLTLSRLMEGFQ